MFTLLIIMGLMIGFVIVATAITAVFGSGILVVFLDVFVGLAVIIGVIKLIKKLCSKD